MNKHFKRIVAMIFFLAISVTAMALITPENMDKARKFSFKAVNFLASNDITSIAEGDVYYNDVDNALVYGTTGGQAVTLVAGSTNTFGATVVLEGATADAYETTITATDPTADRTITAPDASGTVVLSTLATNAPDAANSVTGASNGTVYEGATADAYETTVSATDPTADRSIVLPNAGGTVMLSALATNAVDAANAVTGISNGLLFEGATADAHETTIAPTDATADRTITLPDATGIVDLTVKTVVVYNTSATPRDITAAESGTVFVLASSDGEAVTFNLPAAAAGLTYTFKDLDATAAHDLQIQAGADDTINGGTAAKIYECTGDAVKQSCTITAVDGVKWEVDFEVGTWANDNS